MSNIKTWRERMPKGIAGHIYGSHETICMHEEISDLRTALAERDAKQQESDAAITLAVRGILKRHDDLRTAAQQALEAFNQMRQRWDTDLPIYWTEEHEQLMTSLTASLENK